MGSWPLLHQKTKDDPRDEVKSGLEKQAFNVTLKYEAENWESIIRKQEEATNTGSVFLTVCIL